MCVPKITIYFLNEQVFYPFLFERVQKIIRTSIIAHPD